MKACLASGPFVVGLTISVMLNSSVYASIIIPQPREFTVNFENENVGSMGGDSSSSGAPTQDSKSDEARHLVVSFAAGHSSGTTSSSASGSGSSQSLSALDCTIVYLFANVALTSRLYGEARFAIPMPPIGTLLRPPQE